MRRTVAASALALLAATVADAAELKVLSSNGTSAIVRDLGERFAQATAHKLSYRIDVAVRIQKDIERGEVFDAAFLTAAVVDELIRRGEISRDSRVDVARSGIGVSMQAGAPKPDISTIEGFRRSMLTAKSVVYTPAGGSGIHFLRVLERIGIAEIGRASCRERVYVLV